MRLLAKLALGLATIAVAALVVTNVAAQQPQPKQDSATVHVTDEMIRHSRIQNILYFAGFAYGLVTLAILLPTKFSARMRDIANRVSKKFFVAAMFYFVLFSLVGAVLDFPLSYYAGFVVPHQFDLSTQTFGSWIGDEAKGLLVSLVIGTPIVALALLAISKFRRWWLALWLGSIPVMLLLVVIAPVFIDPLFNKFEPLKDQVLKEKLLSMASKAGIEGGRVYQVDKSKQTKTLNAYVTGIGPTKRIVMWDTIIAKMTHEELLTVMAHEMGHYVLNHLWKGLAWGVLISLVVCFGLQRVYEWGLARWSAAWGVTGSGDAASLPWLMVVVSVIMFLLSPVTNGLSRHTEHEADVFALELTHDNAAFSTAFVKLAEDSKTIPNPHPFIEFWRYSHPSIEHRLQFAAEYKPWEKGEPNKVWRGK